jgi:hypothetical protein
MLFRPVRGGLAEAMAEVVEVRSLSELTKVLGAKSPAKIEFKFQGYDARIGWNSFLITVNGQAAGYTNGIDMEHFSDPIFI